MESLVRSRVIEIGREVADRPEPLADLARQCYADMAVSVEDGASVWRIRLAPLAPMAAAYDGEFAAVLVEMGLSLDDIAGWRRIGSEGRALWLESLNGAWALVAWSRWLAQGGQGRPLIVQLGGGGLRPPPLMCGPEPGAFLGLMEDDHFSLGDPDSVAAAVKRGLVGANSFIVPFLRACPADIVHLAQDAPAPGGQAPSCFSVIAAPWAPDPTLDCLELRPDDQGACSYRQAATPMALAAADDGARPIFVHIDLGSIERLPSRRRPLDRAAVSPAELGEALSPLAGRIAAVTIAYAPGSCPARSWAPRASELRKTLQPLVA